MGEPVWAWTTWIGAMGVTRVARRLNDDGTVTDLDMDGLLARVNDLEAQLTAVIEAKEQAESDAKITMLFHDELAAELNLAVYKREQAEKRATEAERERDEAVASVAAARVAICEIMWPACHTDVADLLGCGDCGKQRTCPAYPVLNGTAGAAMLAERDEAVAACAVLQGIIGTVISTMNETRGVDGWHLNGASATWEDVGLRPLLDDAVDDITAGADMLARHKRLEEAVEYGIVVVCNAHEHTTDDPTTWQTVMRKFLDMANAALATQPGTVQP